MRLPALLTAAAIAPLPLPLPRALLRPLLPLLLLREERELVVLLALVLLHGAVDMRHEPIHLVLLGQSAIALRHLAVGLPPRGVALLPRRPAARGAERQRD